MVQDLYLLNNSNVYTFIKTKFVIKAKIADRSSW